MTSDEKTLPDARQYCPTQTRRKLAEENALLVDVREAEEVAKLAFDVPHIVHIPLSEFEQRFTELPKDRELILACAVGQRSLRATYFLMHHGYDKVANMQDGLAKWVRRGFPVRGDAAAVATSAGTCCCTPSAGDSGGGGCCTPSAPAKASGSCC